MAIRRIFTILLIISFREISGERINLHGEAGQAYAIKIHMGHPHQQLSVIVDTGSTTLAIASYPREDSNKYFHSSNSSSIYDSKKEVQAKYSQGRWVGQLVTDFVQFPSLTLVPEVRCDIVLITESEKFFMNGSAWQGLLGLAYLPVGARGDNIIVESWIDSVDRTVNKPMSFQLKLCGPYSPYNATHYGNFKMLDDHTPSSNTNEIYRTPILRKRWYEVGVLSIRMMAWNQGPNTAKTKSNIHTTSDKKYVPDAEICRKLNEEKSIVDSGTTNIRLPDILFRQVVNELRNAVQSANVLILDEFWYHAEAACWPEPQKWSLPWLAVDLLSLESDQQYFTLEIPPENYMRVITAHNTSSESGSVSEFCYKLGLEAGGKETVLGYTAMEGLEVLFNRSAGWIGWQTSDCGANSRISGPYNTSTSLINLCDLIQPAPDTAISIKAAQWSLCVISIIAGGVLVYLLAPCVKSMLVRKMPSSTQISLSQAALVEQESS